jgi:hypothetical protein
MSYFLTNLSRIGGVIVTMLASSAVDREFKSRSEQTKGYNIGSYIRWDDQDVRFVLMPVDWFL